jgi:hypothetical protein
MGSGAMRDVSNFIKIGSGIQTLLVEIHIQTHRQKAGLARIFSFS